MLQRSLKYGLETSVATALAVTNDVRTVLVNLPMEIGTSAVVTGQVWYVDISLFKHRSPFADIVFL